jgi:hypothetical protein
MRRDTMLVGHLINHTSQLSHNHVSSITHLGFRTAMCLRTVMCLIRHSVVRRCVADVSQRTITTSPRLAILGASHIPREL